jgi:hypothetical protein
MPAVITQDSSVVIQIARNVTGRVDQNDPAFTNTIMYNYLNSFLQAENPTEVRLFEQQLIHCL